MGYAPIACVSCVMPVTWHWDRGKVKKFQCVYFHIIFLLPFLKNYISFILILIFYTLSAEWCQCITINNSIDILTQKIIYSTYIQMSNSLHIKIFTVSILYLHSRRKHIYSVFPRHSGRNLFAQKYKKIDTIYFGPWTAKLINIFISPYLFLDSEDDCALLSRIIPNYP
jgi:hypothetical protein